MHYFWYSGAPVALESSILVCEPIPIRRKSAAPKIGGSMRRTASANRSNLLFEAGVRVI